jgi:hypothetical protein
VEFRELPEEKCQKKGTEMRGNAKKVPDETIKCQKKEQ